MIACPTCKRRIFTRRDILYAPIDGTARCRACGTFCRLDLFSRWILSCLVALALAGLLLSYGVFYSGHLLFVSICIIVAVWRGLAWAGFPLLSLEEFPESKALDSRQSKILVGALLIAALMLDGFIASRFEREDGAGDSRPARSAEHVRR